MLASLRPPGANEAGRTEYSCALGAAVKYADAKAVLYPLLKSIGGGNARSQLQAFDLGTSLFVEKECGIGFLWCFHAHDFRRVTPGARLPHSTGLALSRAARALATRPRDLLRALAVAERVAARMVATAPPIARQKCEQALLRRSTLGNAVKHKRPGFGWTDCGTERAVEAARDAKSRRLGIFSEEDTATRSCVCTKDTHTHTQRERGLDERATQRKEREREKMSGHRGFGGPRHLRRGCGLARVGERRGGLRVRAATAR